MEIENSKRVLFPVVHSSQTFFAGHPQRLLKGKLNTVGMVAMHITSDFSAHRRDIFNLKPVLKSLELQGSKYQIL